MRKSQSGELVDRLDFNTDGVTRSVGSVERDVSVVGGGVDELLARFLGRASGGSLLDCVRHGLSGSSPSRSQQAAVVGSLHTLLNGNLDALMDWTTRGKGLGYGSTYDFVDVGHLPKVGCGRNPVRLKFETPNFHFGAVECAKAKKVGSIYNLKETTG